MSSHRIQPALRLLRNIASQRAAPSPQTRRFESSFAKATEVVPIVPNGNQPDYDIAADKATSYVTWLALD